MGYAKKINCGHPQFTEMCKIVILLHTTPFNNSEHHTIYKNLSVVWFSAVRRGSNSLTSLSKAKLQALSAPN